eukprot:1707918-Pyramimonas_sp.AAC.1
MASSQDCSKMAQGIPKRGPNCPESAQEDHQRRRFGPKRASPDRRRPLLCSMASHMAANAYTIHPWVCAG